MANIESFTLDLPHHPVIESIATASTKLMEHFNSGSIARSSIVEQSTAVIHHLGMTYAMVLATRARELGSQGKFNDGLADAWKAIECVPTSAEGYLVAGQLYSLQGKQQAAIDAYERGLSYVHSSKWPMLYDRREQAKRLLEKRIDFLTLVPTEVVALIFSTVSSVDEEQLLECTMVSKRWRIKLQDCSQLWTNATIRYSHYMNSTAQLLPMVSHNVQTLHMELVSDQRVKLIHALANKNLLSSVNTLVLMFQINAATAMDQYISLTRCFQNTLKDLTIAVHSEVSDQGESTLALDSILAECFNLKRLFISSTSTKINYGSNLDNFSTTPAGPYKLTALEIQVPDTRSLLNDLIPQCPNLRLLSMTCRDPKILNLVDQYCLHLKHLKVCSDPCDDEATDEYKDSQAVGLCSIYYGNSRASCDTGVEHRMMQFFVKSQETLEHLTLNYHAFGIKAQLHHQWFFLAHLGFCNLKVMQIHCQVEVVDLWTIISAVAQRCALLETVSLEMTGPVPKEFFMSLIASPLRTLNLYSFNDRSCDSLVKLFDHHSALGQRSTLQNVAVARCGAITESALSALANIRTLCTLKLVGPINALTANQTKAFLHKLAGIPRLSNILLERIQHVELDSLDELQEALGLKKTKYINLDEAACYVQLKS